MTSDCDVVTDGGEPTAYDVTSPKLLGLSGAMPEVRSCMMSSSHIDGNFTCDRSPYCVTGTH